MTLLTDHLQIYARRTNFPASCTLALATQLRCRSLGETSCKSQAEGDGPYCFHCGAIKFGEGSWESFRSTRDLFRMINKSARPPFITGPEIQHEWDGSEDGSVVQQPARDWISRKKPWRHGLNFIAAVCKTIGNSARHLSEMGLFVLRSRTCRQTATALQQLHHAKPVASGDLNSEAQLSRFWPRE